MHIQINTSEMCQLWSDINMRKCLSDDRHDTVSFTMATLPVLMDLKQINISGVHLKSKLNKLACA